MKIVWDLTYKCNLKCVYCGAEKCEKSAIDFNTDWEKIVNDFVENKVNYVELLGGEPLLHPHFFDICWLLKNNGIDFSVITNAQFPVTYADSLIEENPATVLISLDGLEKYNDLLRGNGSFRKAINFLRYFTKIKRERNNKVSIGINCVLSQINVRQMREYIMFLEKETDIEFIQINEVISWGTPFLENDVLLSPNSLLDGLEEIAKLSVTLKRIKIYLNISFPLVSEYLNFKFNTDFEVQSYSCDAGSLTAFVRPDGGIFPCRTYNKRIFKSLGEVFSSNIMDELGMGQLYLDCQECEYYEKCHSCPLKKPMKRPKICQETETRYISFVSRFTSIVFKMNEMYSIIKNDFKYFVFDGEHDNIIEELTLEGFLILSSLEKWLSPTEIAENLSLDTFETTLLILDFVKKNIVIGGDEYEKNFE